MRIRYAAVAAVLAVGLTAACTASPSSSSNSGTVTIGVDAELTGDGAGTYGQPQDQGMKLALTDITTSGYLGGTTLKLDIQDNGTTDGQAVTVFNQLVQDGAPVVLQGSRTSALTAIKPFALRDQVTLINMGGGGLGDDTPDYLFRMSDLKTPAGSLGTYLVKTKSAKKIALIIDQDNSAMVGMSQVFADAVTAAGGQLVVTVPIASADSDFANPLAQVAATNPDVLAVFAAPPQSGNILAQARTTGQLGSVLFAGQTGWSQQVADIAGSAAQGAVFGTIWLPGGAQSATFEQEYQAAYGAPVTNANAAIAYSTIWLIAVAVKQILAAGQPVTGTTIKDALPAASTSTDFQQHSLIPNFSLPDSGAPVIPGVIATFADGKIVAAE